MSTMPPFAPMFVLPWENNMFGLPSPSCQPDIANLVMTASMMIDEYCGRTDGDGSGSLVYTTYQERILSQSPGRNMSYLPHRPLSTITATQQQNIILSGANFAGQVPGLFQPFYTGFFLSPNVLADGTLSAVLAASGRYAFPRRDTYPMSNDPYAFVNPLTIITLFGGPPPWVPIDMGATGGLDYDPLTGEIWTSSGMWLERYTEIIFTYNSGYDPTNMPYKIKVATALLVKNMMIRSGSTGMRSFSFGKAGIGAQFDPDLIDDNIKRMLIAFVSTRSY